MTNRLVASLLLALGVLLPASPLDAQGIADRVKKKVGEKANAAAKKDPAAAAGAAVASDQSKAPAPITSATLSAFLRGLRAERDHRKATVKLLSTVKTREQYNACQGALAAGPEAQKIMMAIGNLPENASQEQMQKASQKMQTDLAKLLTDKCGENPGTYNDSWRARQVDSAEAAGVRAFAAALATPSGGGGPFLSLEREEQEPEKSELYRFLKEWLPPFCKLSESTREQAEKDGVKVPGKGKDIYFVYTAAEARVINKVCDDLDSYFADLQ